MSRAIKNTAVVAAPTAAASASKPAAGTAHYYEWTKDQDGTEMFIILEDATGPTVAIDRAEIEIFAYLTNDDKPAYWWRAAISGPTGRVQTPIVVPTCDITAIYVRQGAQDAVIGAAAAQNPAVKYQLIWQ